MVFPRFPRAAIRTVPFSDRYLTTRVSLFSGGLLSLSSTQRALRIVDLTPPR